MTPTGATHRLGELDQELHQAWGDYYDRLQPLSGSEYEEAELDAWTALQAELHRLERRRRLLELSVD